MSKYCLTCNCQVIGKSIICEYVNINLTICKLLEEILDKKIPLKDLHSNAICKRCYNLSMDYDSMKIRMHHIKTDLTNKFTKSLSKNGFNYNSYPVCTSQEKSPVKVGNKVVLPASKLQPLPPNYVIDIAKLPKNLTLPSSSVNVTVTVGSKVITQNVPMASLTMKSETVTTNSSQSVESNVASSLSTILGNKTSTAMSTANSMMTFNVLPKNFLATKKDDDVKLETVDGDDDENDEEVQNNEEVMEIDEEDNSHSTMEDPLHTESPQSNSNKKYIDVSLMPAEGSSDDTILGKLQILDQDGDEDGETIVMTGENGSILRIVSGQKLVYENGEITLATDDEDEDVEGNQADDDDGNNEHDSNDESQIELQVSGDEETANAIIAAAQEQGGAFIKVESGEMFRVKSVKSHPGSNDLTDKDGDNASLQIVALKGKQFQCLLCEEKGDIASKVCDAEEMMQHLKHEHDARLYLCQICKKIMRKRFEYTAHLEGHSAEMKLPSEKRIHECALCKKKYNSRTLLVEHMNMHSGTRPYACAVCGKAFTSKYTHQAHLKTHLERPRPYSCKQCSKTFLTMQNLNQHQKTHLGIKDFICKVCGKAFGTQHNLEVHGVVHSGAKPFVCGVCGKAFARRAEVRDHMRIHTGERPFACEICGATFTQRSNLHSHKRATHLNDQRYQCTVCPKKFKRRRLLDYHMKAAHTGERPLECDICHATFVYPEHYKKHARIHSGEKPYVCEVCGKSFNSRDNRNTHRFVHSDKKPYECLACGAGYMRKQLLYAHMNTSGHLAESIVVNQPRVQKVKRTIRSDTKTENNLEMLLEENTQDMDISKDVNTTEEVVITESDSVPKFYINEEKKLVLQDGKSTINLVQENDDPSLLTFIQNLDGSKPDALQGISTDHLGDQEVQMVTSDENGAIRLVQLHINADPATWNITTM